jgi:predicted transcriptional regulator
MGRSINYKSITEDDRQRIILDFIRSNPSCNAQYVVEKLENQISRVTVFKILHKLMENGAVKSYLENNQKRNARDHKLYVEEGNPLVSVRLELDKFEGAYFDLFNKSLLELDTEHISATLVRIRKTRPYDASRAIEFLEQLGRLVENLFHIFYSMVDAYLFRFLFIWSRKISDQQVLQQLYSMVFSKIADMQTRISESFKSTTLRDINNFIAPFIVERFRGYIGVDEEPKGSRTFLQYLDSFKEFGLEKEIEAVIDSLWKIIGDLQQYVYPEPRIYRWPFKYGEDNWRKLVSLLRQHPESIPSDLGLMIKIFKSISAANRGKQHENL